LFHYTIGSFKVATYWLLIMLLILPLISSYLIRRTKRRPISDIMNLVDDYSGWPTYCPLLIGQLIQNPNSD
jgi:hypothetical protein